MADGETHRSHSSSHAETHTPHTSLQQHPSLTLVLHFFPDFVPSSEHMAIGLLSPFPGSTPMHLLYRLTPSPILQSSPPLSLGGEVIQRAGIVRTVQCEWYSRGSASRTPNSNATPSAALAHNVSTPPTAAMHAQRGRKETKPPPILRLTLTWHLFLRHCSVRFYLTSFCPSPFLPTLPFLSPLMSCSTTSPGEGAGRR
ncbi:unnamed protein product [Pleuronectes platessa]|uniref:Uncharacterized protein n=1 Tax=Pleuronectes platessa TaxID=8262 RepID=A0A9N7VUL4_PLEPL|nr:unnamed protein product [Pleuronectes platessa]